MDSLGVLGFPGFFKAKMLDKTDDKSMENWLENEPKLASISTKIGQNLNETIRSDESKMENEPKLVKISIKRPNKWKNWQESLEVKIA